MDAELDDIGGIAGLLERDALRGGQRQLPCASDHSLGNDPNDCRDEPLQRGRDHPQSLRRAPSISRGRTPSTKYTSTGAMTIVGGPDPGRWIWPGHRN